MTAYEQFTETPSSSSPDVKSTAKDEAGAVAGTAKQEAGAVTQTATQAATEVAGTAKEQAFNVAGEAKAQISGLVSQAKEQAGEQATQRQQKAAQAVRGVADQLQGISRGEAPSGMAADIVEQITGKVREIADRLENADPQQLLVEVRKFARNKPGGFLLSAAAAGFLSGRMVKGAKGDSSADDAGTAIDTPSYVTTGYSTGSEYASPTFDAAAGVPAYSSETVGYPNGDIATETSGYGNGSFAADLTYPDEPRRVDPGGTI